ncbi:hypothetical protein C3K47_12255 [Solitalea longa]|uniref:LPS-assembly protein LptD central domain-containing protein n=1 Tax=Solitalea longa TaxID=2079460 RepID=A0A2S5A053_9SPHI|nr:hypothetical protein C3K47_12255 [Solitalea longa]
MISAITSKTNAYDRKLHSLSFHTSALTDTIRKSGSKKDSIRMDTATQRVKINPKAGTALKSKVEYNAKDSILADISGKYLYLYKDAEVKFEGMTLKADFIRVDQQTMIVYAKGAIDSSGTYSGRPFMTGEGSDLIADSLAYNFKSKKAKVWSGVSKEGEGFIRGGQMKLNENKEGFLKGGTYTTCNDPDHVHFGIKITKAKVMENRVVTGPAYMYIEDIPTPLVVPFGFFPKTSKRANGIIFPSVGEDQQKGFFLRDMGYYLGLSDNIDAALKASIFTNGSYDLGLSSRYVVRYKYSGNLNFNYSNSRYGEEGTSTFQNTKDFQVMWSHGQSRQGTGSSFSASVNLTSSKFYQNTGNFVPLPNRFNNTSNSSISYSKTWQGKMPINLSSSLSASQQFNTGAINLTLPTLTLNGIQFTPFDSPRRIGPPTWYSKVRLTYGMALSNTVNTYDSLLFSSSAPPEHQFKTLVNHTASLQTSFNVLKYINISPNMPYTENWYFRTITKEYNAGNDQVETTYHNGFKAERSYALSVGASTTLYGMAQFKKGGIKAIRHTLRPNVSYSYKPDFSDPKYGYVKTYTDKNNNEVPYSVFESGSSSYGRSSVIGFGLSNNLEMKVRSAKDTVNGEKKISILNELSLNSSYNFAAKEFNLAPFSLAGFTNLFKTINLNFGASLDPYAVNDEGQRINKFSINEGGPLVNLTNANISLSANFNSKAKNRPQYTTQQQRDLYLVDPNPNNFIDFNIPWNVGINYAFNYSRSYSNGNRFNNFFQTINVNGDFNLTQKWKISGMTGYDVSSQTISPTTLSIARDLHCWDLQVYWVPFGQYKQYSIDLRVKSSILQDLKLSKRRPYYYDDAY